MENKFVFADFAMYRLNPQQPEIPPQYLGMEKHRDIKACCQIRSEWNRYVTASLHGDDADSNDATDHIGDEESEKGDFRSS